MTDYEKFGGYDGEEELYDNGYVQPSIEEISAEVRSNPAPASESVRSDEHDKPLFQKKPGFANIVVCGIGGGGGNAVNNMFDTVDSAKFIVMNTDMQALNMARVPSNCKIQLGKETTGGLGAGSNPDVGRAAAEESRDYLKSILKGVDLLFITAGMGGGTGTGAAPIVAEIAHSMGILTVAVVTKPFDFEGEKRAENAELGIRSLKKFVDTMLVIPNQKLIEVMPKNISFKEAFKKADDVLCQGVKGVSDVISKPSLINLDFADVRTILLNKGYAHMGIGSAKGEKRIVEAMKQAVTNPLSEDSIEGAKGIILYIVGGENLLLSEVNEACQIVRQVVDPHALIIFGQGVEADKEDVTITVVATGFDEKNIGKNRSLNINASASDPIVTANIEYAAADVTAEPVEYNPDIFASRPTFDKHSKPEPPSAPAPAPIAPAAPVAPVAPVAPAAPAAPAESEIHSSRIDISKNGKQVPAFLRKIRGDRS